MSAAMRMGIARVGGERVVRALIAVLLLPWPGSAGAQAPVTARETLVAQAASPSDSLATTAAPIANARELIKSGDYDRAIEILRAEIARSADQPAELREAYLQLIKTYVFLGNDYKFRPQGREASNLNYRAARELIAEALENPVLRHTQPEPATEFPPEMIAFFAEVRSRLFGGFRVIALDPPGALVLLDGDTLRTPPGESAPAADDLRVGSHTVAVRAAGYKDVRETITISPNATLERSYRLEKRRSAGWYVARVAGALGVIGGTIALVAGRKDGATGPESLPGAPPPP